MRREFKEGDYIVVLKLGSLSTSCAKENYCFKQREDDQCLAPVCDLVGDRNNANRTLKFDKSDKLLDWRYATDKEIVEYDNIGKPYEVTPVDGLPQQYIVATTNVEETDMVATYIKGYPTNYSRRYQYVICHDGLLDTDKKDSNLWDRIPSEVEHFPTLTYQEWFNLAHPTNTIPEKWYMLLDNLSDEGLELVNEWRRSVCTTRRAHTIEQHHILLNCHEDGSYYYGHARISCLKDESWANGIKEITFDQFIKHILKQETKEVMTKQKLTVSITEVLKIHSIACSSWKSIISSNYLPRVDNAQNITFNQHEIDAMFKAATPLQLPTLENIFGKQVKELTLKDIADGKPLFRENAKEGLAAMIEPRIGYSDLADKAFWLSRSYNWELRNDSDGDLCLVPTPKQ